MRRFVAYLLLAFALVLSGPALAAPSHDCPMTTASDMAANHQDMGCCKLSCSSECAVVCPAALEPPLAKVVASTDLRERMLPVATDVLLSAILGSADPPPRTTFS